MLCKYFVFAAGLYNSLLGLSAFIDHTYLPYTIIDSPSLTPFHSINCCFLVNVVNDSACDAHSTLIWVDMLVSHTLYSGFHSETYIGIIPYLTFAVVWTYHENNQFWWQLTILVPQNQTAEKNDLALFLFWPLQFMPYFLTRPSHAWRSRVMRDLVGWEYPNGAHFLCDIGKYIYKTRSTNKVFV